MSTATPTMKRTTTRKPLHKRIPLDKLVLEPYQRAENAPQVAKIVGGYDQALDIPFEVADLGNEYYAILDGQHRKAGKILRGESDALCRVHFDLSYEERADLFGKFQTERRGISPLDRHTASVEAKNKDALLLDLLVREEGYRITRHDVHGALMGVGSLTKAYKKYGPVPLRRALQTIAQAWGKDDRSALKAPMVYGMVFLFYKHPELDHERCVRRFGSKNTMHIAAAAAANYNLSVSGAGRAWMMVSRQLLAIYNDGLRENTVTSRLDS